MAARLDRLWGIFDNRDKAIAWLSAEKQNLAPTDN
jgi:hypothetical protein